MDRKKKQMKSKPTQLLTRDNREKLGMGEFFSSMEKHTNLLFGSTKSALSHEYKD